MANLIIVDSKKDTTILNEQVVHPEHAIEKLIFETKNIFPDVILLKRQLQTYSGEERIDLVGIDRENNILVIEIKDETVDVNVIPQVLRYAVWVETHPDAIKSIWLEQKDKLGDSVFDWEKAISVKIVVVGPSFKPSVQKLINRISYPVDLVEFKKFAHPDNSYVFLNTLTVEEEKAAKPVSAQREYDKEFYKKHYNPHSAEEFWKLGNSLEEYIKKPGWNLSRSNNKGYIAFKYGFFIAFGVTFVGSKSFCLFFKVPRDIAEKVKIEGQEMYRYEEQWNQVLYKVESGDVDISRFQPLLKAAYQNIVGGK